MTEAKAEETNRQHQGRGSLLFDTWFGKWFVQRLPAALLWFWFLLRFLNQPLPFANDISREILLLPALIAAVVMLFFGRFLRLIAYPFYILFFPVLALFLSAKIINMPVRLSRYAVSGRGTLLLLIVAAAGLVITYASKDVSVRAIAFLVTHVALYATFLRSLPWAANPYNPLVGAVGFFAERGTALAERLVEPAFEGKLVQSPEGAIRICGWGIKTIDYLSPPGAPRQGGITGFAYNQLLPLTIYGFGFIYILLAMSFSGALLFLERAWGTQISGIAADPTLFDYFYFSFLSQATAVPDNIQPLTPVGQAWLIWLVLTGILLLIVLIAMFTTSVGVHGDSAISQMQTHLHRARQQLKDWRDELTAEVVEEEDGDTLEGEFVALETPHEEE